MNEWELLKENVEPIKSGRSIKTLKSALNEKPTDKDARELKRKEYESELRTYTGSDPLSVYFDYIQWIEQNYPLGGEEANLQTVLSRCIEQFHSTDQYKNDERLLKVFLKLIKRVDDPLEVFNFFHETGFASELSDFYINWSFHLENHKNCRKAAEVLRTGMEKKALPSAALKRSLEELEVRVAKAVVNNQTEELNDNSDDEQRKPLNGLKAKTKKGKSVAPTKRVGNAIKSTAGLKNCAPNSVQNKVPVYCDENDPSVKPKVTAPPPFSRNPKPVITSGQENSKKPEKWSENKIKQKVVVIEAQPKFAIHADDSDEDSPEPPKRTQESNTLKLRPKGADSPPIARFEKPDPLKKFAFNMNKVYAGGEEFSFEEIRGRKWMAKKRREEEALESKKLHEEVAQLRQQVELLLKSQQMAQQLSQQSSQQSIQSNAIQQQTKEVSSHPLSSAESSTSKSANSTKGSHSIGNGTTAAFSLVRDLWNGTLANQTTNSEEINQKNDIIAVIDKTEEQNKNPEPFAIYSDTTILSQSRDKMAKPRESIGSNEYTIALPKTEMTFFANTNCASTPVNDKSKKSGDYNFCAIPPLQNNAYNFVGGLTAKLSPIVETSREYNSKSSSSSSGTPGTMSTTGGHAISRRTRVLSGVENIDPFDVHLLNQLLESMAEPINSRKGFYRINKSLPKIKSSEKAVLKLGPDFYMVHKLIATGAYAQVYTAQIDISEDQENDSCGISKYMSQKWFALKVVKQANEWEFYICDELQKRLYRSKCIPDIELSVMAANPTVMFKDGCVLVDEFAPDGTLIDVINVVKSQTKPYQFPNSLTAYFALELIQIVTQIHRQLIIHGDLKPDNILVINFPSREDVLNVLKRTSSLKVIDFGRAIDLNLFPDGTTFNVNVNTKGSQCCEMLDQKPWTFQTDWFGVLDCIHVMIFGDYIKVHKNNETNKWEIIEKFKRYHLKDIWKPLFDELLNIPDCNEPDLTQFVKQLVEYIKENVDQIVRDAIDIEKLNDSALKKRK